MRIANELTIHLDGKRLTPALDAVQGDTARAMVLSLHSNGSAWTVPPEVTSVVIRFRKADGTGGVYSKLPDGTAAWSISGNKVTVALAPQVLTVSGPVEVQVALVAGTGVLAAFSVTVQVQRDPSIGVLQSLDYVNLESWKVLQSELLAKGVTTRMDVSYVPGSINTGTGAEASQTARIRSGYFPVRCGQKFGVIAPQNVKWRLVAYDEGLSFLNAGQHSAFITGSGEYVPKNSATAFGRLIVGYSDDSEVTDVQALASLVTVYWPVENGGPPIKWYALGDSITQGYYSDEEGLKLDAALGWAALAAKYNGWALTNHAVGGSGYVCSATVGDKLNARDHVDTIDFADAELVTMAFGVNDWKGGYPLGNMTDDVAAGGTFYSNMRYCIEKILSDCPCAKVVVISPVNCCAHGVQEDNWGIGYGFVGGTLEDFCNAEREICAHYGIEFVDVLHGSVINRENIQSLLPDGVHPTLDCHRLLAVELSRKLMGVNPPAQRVIGGTFDIIITDNGDGTYSADKTYEEIRAAEAEGLVLRCHCNKRVLWPVYSPDSYITFGCVVNDVSHRVIIDATRVKVYETELTPSSRKINGKALSDDISLTAEDVGAVNPADIEVLYQALNPTDLGQIVQGSPRADDGVIYASDVSICTATPVCLGENTAYNVYCATGWVYTICEYYDASFANGEKTADKSSDSTFTTQKPYAMLRFNKMVDGAAVAITPDDFNNAVVFCKNESDTKVKNVYAALGIVDFESFVQGAPHPNGHIVESAKSICTSKILHLGANVTYNVLLADNWVYSVTEYLDANGAEGGERTAYMSTSPLFTPTKPYARIRFNKLDEKGESVDITPDDFDWSCIFQKQEQANGGIRSDVPENIGVLNAILNAKQCREIKYTPLVALPAQRGDFPANVEVQGLPYSSTRFDQLYVPNNVSFYTFMSALRNPNSLLYTERLDGEPYNLTNARTYYATVCSIFVEYALGIKPGYVTGIWSQIPGMELIENQSAYGLKLGDVLWQTGHVRLVTDIKRDNRGRIHDIEIMDAWPPVVRVTHYTAETFESEIMEEGQHKIYRYRYIYKAKHTPTAIVPVEDESIATPVTYNANLMGRHGDNFNVRAGTDVVLDVLDSGAYTQYTVAKNGAVLTTETIPADNVITLSELGYGSYSVFLTNGTARSESIKFIVVDANISAVQNEPGKYKVTFSSANATPVYLGWFTDDVNMKHLDVLTDEDVAAGEKTSTHSTEAYNVWVAVETVFGIILSERVRIDI